MDSYDSSIDPPAPILDVTVSNPHNPTVGTIEEKALIDSGAFKTVIPEECVCRLRLLPVRPFSPKGYKIQKKKQEHYSYIVKISFKGLTFVIEAIAVNRKNVLVGRDILNDLKLILDGKNLNFEITDP